MHVKDTLAQSLHCAEISVRKMIQWQHVNVNFPELWVKTVGSKMIVNFWLGIHLFTSILKWNINSTIESVSGETCIIPELTPPPPPPDPTIPAEIKVIVIATEKSSATVLILCLILTLFLFCIMRVYTIVRVIQMNMEISLILANALAVVIPNFSEYEQVN